MSNASLNKIVSYTDKLLRIPAVRDYDRACNGLQVENTGAVTRIAAAVDASLATVRKAAAARADLMIVHHGLFWSATHPWTGKRYELIRLLLDNNVAVYSAHLPLDLHPKLGNNALLAKAMGLGRLKPFFYDREQWLGFKGTARSDLSILARKLQSAVGVEPTIIPGGPKTCRNVGVVTGGAGDELAKAAAEGVDTFITGEGRHWTYALAEELGINVLYGGHYATETFGVKALAAELSKKFRVPWLFIDHPTGL